MSAPVNPISGKPLGGTPAPAAGSGTSSGTGGIIGSAEKTIQGLFGANTTGQQLLIYGILQQLLGAALLPAVSDIQQAVNSVDPVATLTPEQLAVGVLRGLLDPGNSASEAAKSGIGPGRFQQLQQLAASPPALSLILAAYQRTKGQVGAGADAGVDIDEALADLGIDTRYRPLVKALSIDVPSAQAVMEALLEGQITREEALTRYTAAGGDPDWFDTDYNRQGQAPTPTQALEMLNRGLIPADGTGPDSTSYNQAFLEGPWRNKWLTPFEGLRYYLTPPRSIVAQLRSGAIDQARATELLKANGLNDQTIAEYLHEGSAHATAAARELSQSQVVAAYEAKLITAAEATTDLQALRYTASDARLILALADKKQATSAARSAVTRIQTLYLSGKDTAATATTALRSLGLDDGAVSALLATWELEKTTTTRTLSEAQIVAGVVYGAITQATAIVRLVALGYDEQDANILIINRTHELPVGWVAI